MNQLALVEPDLGPIVQRTIVLPFLPISKNVYDSWQHMWKKGHREKWFKHLFEQFDSQQFPRNAERVVCHATLWFPSKGRRDWQNYMKPMWDVVPDALVRYGCIADDTPNYFNVGPNGGITFAVDKRPYVQPIQKRRTVLGFAFST